MYAPHTIVMSFISAVSNFDSYLFADIASSPFFAQLTGFAFASGSIALEKKVLQTYVRARLQHVTNDTTAGIDFSALNNFSSRLGVIVIVIASFFLSISIFGILGTFYSNVTCLNVVSMSYHITLILSFHMVNFVDRNSSMCLCVRACVRACGRVFVCILYVCVCACMASCQWACVHANKHACDCWMQCL